MVKTKLLLIEQCYFNLPDEFEGTLGEALMLLAQYRLECEKNNKITDDTIADSTTNCYQELMKKSDSNCSMTYNLIKLSQDGTHWEEL